VYLLLLQHFSLDNTSLQLAENFTYEELWPDWQT